MTTRTQRPYLVFCDVDETLISTKSMFDFLAFHTPPGVYRRVAGELRSMADRGVPRTEVNRAYYRAYRGAPVAEIREAGRRWYADRAAREGFYLADTLRALREHRRAGAALVLVSGSFDACLDPIAEAVDASHVLCTRPLTARGRYTGEIETPMIGEHKEAAVQRLLDEHSTVDPADCYAYGDHPSDLPMLDLVGHPVAVGDHPEVLAHLAARRRRRAGHSTAGHSTAVRPTARGARA
ncbi:HAD family hydrolase [Streptomyces millisiae]|uniref:HAD family hydrolase n=1 Tax=Streptomyces millisiae TaxID=3075542 RepID=A0ABU2LT54_9ACTN|nr:HAD family hydrolase [Streptomyces sp. DSM 44918]MDT0320779.1 HAD family hydrolase [Streptomyces sp. DSM 44918]